MFKFVFDVLALYMQFMSDYWFYAVFALALCSCIPVILRHFFRG